MKFLIHATYHDSKNTVTLGFPTAFHRALHAILMAAQPVDLRFEDK